MEARPERGAMRPSVGSVVLVRMKEEVLVGMVGESEWKAGRGGEMGEVEKGYGDVDVDVDVETTGDVS